MKTVGKQLQEARLAKNWTPELAARETKIKVDRLRDLEADDYSHFTSPTYARGFVRTYARALGLDEYRVLRQLDSKLPDDDSANIVTDNCGVAYLPETAMPARVAHRDFTGLYIVAGLGAVVSLAIFFVLFQLYRVGELQRYFNNGHDSVAASSPATTTAVTTSTNSSGDAVARALPIDSNTPPPIAEASPAKNSPADATTNGPAAVAEATNAVTEVASAADSAAASVPRAMPVDPSVVASSNDPSAVPLAVAPKALPVDSSGAPSPAPTQDPTITTPANVAPDVTSAKAPPRALPVTAADLAAAASDSASTNFLIAMNTAPPVNAPPPAPPRVHISSSARQSNSGPVKEAAIADPEDASPAAPIPTAVPVVPVAPIEAAPHATGSGKEKRLVLIASQDSFVRVTKLDGSDAGNPVYASVLHSGQSVGFDGRKFSINVGVPSAVDIQLDGVNYGPHSDRESPETFTVQSHLP
jgi:cytoskeleton protein RodZ